MASTRSRQRKLARDKYERQMGRRALRQRRRRQIQAAVGAFAVVSLVVVGVVWLAGGFDSEPEPVAIDDCIWLPQEGNPDRLEAGTPPGNPPTTGMRTVTMSLDAGGAGSGEVQMQLQVDTDPCSVASLEHLAAQGFYDGTTCHELLFGALRCGDPSGTGRGGPTYSFWAGENIPEMPSDEETDGDGSEEAPLAYPAGTVAFGDASGGGGSQFMIFYEDFHTTSPLWSIVGEVTGGLDLLQSVGAAGTQEGSTAPAELVEVRTLTVTDPEAGDAPPANES